MLGREIDLEPLPRHQLDERQNTTMHKCLHKVDMLASASTSSTGAVVLQEFVAPHTLALGSVCGFKRRNPPQSKTSKVPTLTDFHWWGLDDALRLWVAKPRM